MKKSGRVHTLIIAVIGSNQCSREEAINAETIGRELAKKGAIIICGGMGSVMEAVGRGASMEDGITVGILPSDEPLSANKFVKIPVATGLGQARNVAVVKSAHAVIAVGGDYGTLSEIAFALKSKIPVIGLNTWFLRKNQQDDTAVVEAKNAADAIKKAIALSKKEKQEKNEI